MSAPGRWLRTLAHLSAAQVWHRTRLGLRRRWWERTQGRVDARYRRRAERLAPTRFDHPGLAAVARLREAARPADEALAAARDALVGRFRFLGRSLELGRPVCWQRADLDTGTRLWKTLLHELSVAEDLARAFRLSGESAYRERLFELVADWRAGSPIGCRGFARDAWNARAVANRLVHLAVAGSLLGVGRDDPQAERLGREIGLHGLFLRDNLELDLRGNHLLRNAVGLVFAQELCGGVPDAAALLESEVREQFLDDGCHVERVPLYHAIAVRDLLETQALLGDRAPGWLIDALRRAAGFLEALLLGDGELPLLGDSWLGELDPRRLAAAVRERVGDPIPTRGGASGLLALASGSARAVLRAGPHGPDYQLGHAHADLLSFELSLGAHRVVTDTGTSTYDAGAERQQLRSTAAHNTLQLDGAEQIEAWGSFRTGRRGRASLRMRGESGGWCWAWARHDAWRQLSGAPVHERLLAVGDGAAFVLDAVAGAGRHRIESRLHLHPDRPAWVRAAALGAPARTERGPLHERFGETREMPVLVVEAEAELPWLGGWWIGGAAELPALRVSDGALELHRGGRRLAVWRPAAPADPLAVRIEAGPGSC